MKIINNTIVFFIGVLLLNCISCDVIEGDYMTSDVINPNDTNTFVKKVLIEDFTGHRCPNCPSAAEELAALQNFYGDKVIGIAIHPSSQAFSTPSPLTSSSYTYDFRTEFGDDLDDVFGMTDAGLPVGMVNRIGYNTNHQLSKEEWAGVVQTELDKVPVFGISVSSDVLNGEGTISVNVESLSDLNESYNVVVCLTENNIIEWQTDNTAGDINDYEHNHVLRTILNSTFGETIGNNFTEGDVWEKNYSVNITDLENQNEDYSLNTLFMGNGNCKNWEEDNMEIVVYVYKTASYEIVQVEQIHLTNHSL